ncbi:MAG: SBBP repeat-containing protein [bacterium]|nr:SBBP repeat-containing protein [bacterium]
MHRSIISLLAVILLIASISIAQNLTIQVTPPITPLEIPETGGSFTYQVSVTNHELTPQQCTLWCIITEPDGEQRLTLQPLTASIAAGQTIQRSYTQSAPAYSPVGNYVLTANIGIYPNTVWDSDQFTFYKLKPPEWVARYNGTGNSEDDASSLAVDNSGNIYVTGYSVDGGTNADYTTIKYDNDGNQLWVARYNGPANSGDFANDITTDNFGNVYVTGFSVGNGTSYDYATIKYDSNGNELWVARYNGPGNQNDQANFLALDNSGNVYVTGYSAQNGTNPYNFDYATIKYDPSGNQLWAARYNGPGNSSDHAISFAVDSFGNVYVTGYSIGSEYSYDYATIKYDTNGNQLWVARYYGPTNLDEAASSLALDSFGNVYVTGYEGSWSIYDYATIKYDPDGNQLWVARYNGPGNQDDVANSLAVDGNGNVYVTGYSAQNGTPPYYHDYATIKYDANGNQLWVARYDGPGNQHDEAASLVLDDNGNVYVTGFSRGSGTSYDYTTIKYNTNGNVLWVACYNGPGNYNDQANSLAIDGSGNIYVTGSSYGSGTGVDYCTLKYSATDLPNWQQPVATAFGAPLPKEHHLQQNSPNPFNPTTTIRYELPTNSHVSLEVFDVSGRLVTTLINGMREVGNHEVTFDASGLAAGVYVYRLQAGEYTGVQKMVLLK